MEKKVTLEDIAAKMNTSIVTVSNALAGRSGVSEELRARIEKTAEELGYQKKVRRENGTLSGEEKAFAGVRIGVIVWDKHLSKYTSFYWEQYQKVVMEASREGCFVLLELLTDESIEKMRMPQFVEEHQADALILLGMMPEAYVREICRSISYPVLMLDFDVESIPCDAVISNGFFGMYQMTNYLIHMGHRRIGFLGEYRATGSIMDRYQGYVKSLMEHGIEQRPDWILPDRDLVSGFGVLPELPKDMPEAFVCACDLTASEFAELLIKKGYDIPGDISMVSFDDFLLKGVMVNRLTTYAVDMTFMARESLKLLFERLSGKRSEKRIRIVDGKAVIRSSVKDRRKREEIKNGDYL